MKLKNFLQLLGLRGRPRHYGHSIKVFHVEGLPQPVHYAQWLHPRETAKSVDAAIIREYRKFIRRGDLCIDVGAHTGDSVLPMALAAGRAGMVIALEPNPYVYPVLEKNARLNRGQANIQPIMAAAAPSDGFMTFEYSDSGFCNGGRHEGISRFRHGHAFELKVATIDLAAELELCFPSELPRLRFIKTDAEGYDLYVLQALAPLIARCRPYIKAEVFKKSPREYREQMVRFLQAQGYVVHKTTDDANLQGPEISPADVMRWPHYDVFCVPAGS